MDLIALAVPFFLLALLIEMLVDRVRGSGYFRGNDTINSLSAGTLDTTFGYFLNFIPAAIFAYVLRDLSILDIELTSFDLSATGLLYWLVALISLDFCYYWRHRLGHEISVMWATHAVHHQSEDYNLSTALRQSSTGFLFNWIFYLPLFVLGMPFEVFITVAAIDLIYQFWVHTQVIRRLGWMDRVFVTPSNHRVHHAQNEIYIDKNYGGILILWDRLFGTFQDELDSEPVVFGVRKPLQSWNPFWANLQVFDYLLFDALRTRKWRDKIGVWFHRTGWRPADMVARFPKQKSNPDEFEKFNPEVSSGVRFYVLVQFLFAVLLVLWIGQLFAADGPRAVIVPCVLLWALLFSIGQFNESKSSAANFEAFRLYVVVPIGVYGLLQGAGASWDTATAWAVAAGYIALSVILLGLTPKVEVKA